MSSLLSVVEWMLHGGVCCAGRFGLPGYDCSPMSDNTDLRGQEKAQDHNNPPGILFIRVIIYYIATVSSLMIVSAKFNTGVQLG